MWDLVGNPEDRFSQNETHMYLCFSLRLKASFLKSQRQCSYFLCIGDVQVNDDDLLNEATQVIYYIEDGVVARYVYTYSHIYFHFECIIKI